MKSIMLRNLVWLRLVVMVIAVCLAAQPLVPVAAMAAEEPGTPEAAIPSDNKQVAAGEHDNPNNIKIDEAKEPVPVIDEQKINRPVDIADAARKNPVPTEPTEPAEEDEEGLPTIAKVGIGVGAAAVVGIAVALVAGGSKEESGPTGPTLPTSEILVGRWNGRGTSHEDNRTYSGVYDLYTIGSHNYDIYVTGDDVRKQGHGTWTLVAGTNTLQLENDTGSVYVGDFQNEDFTTISMTTTNGNWGLVLTKQ